MPGVRCSSGSSMDQSELGVHGRRDTEREIVYAVVAFSLCLSQKVLSLMTMEGGRVPWVLGCMELLSPSCVTVLLGPAAPHIALM